MAPEQARGEALDARGDVYALGATLYHLLAGAPPYSGTSATEVIDDGARTTCGRSPRPRPARRASWSRSSRRRWRSTPASATRTPARSPRTCGGSSPVSSSPRTATRAASGSRGSRAPSRARSVVAALATGRGRGARVDQRASHPARARHRDTARSAKPSASARVAAAQANKLASAPTSCSIAHARALLDASPTEAIAALEQIESSAARRSPTRSPRSRRRRSCAALRWGLPTLRDSITSFEMTRDGKRLLELDRFGRLQLFDLDARNAIAQREISGAFGATWVDNDTKILMLRSKDQPPALFDPATNTIEDIATAMRAYAKTPDGKLLAYADTASVGIFDPATRTVTQLWRGKPSATVAIASDGSWVAFGDSAKRWRVVDRSGRVLLDRPGDVASFAVSRTGKLAVLRFGELVETKPGDDKPIGATVPLQPADARFVYSIRYRGDTLVMFSDRVMLTWDGVRLSRGATFESSILTGSETAGGAIAAVGNDNHVHVVRDDLHLTLPLTDLPPGMLRVAASPESTRIAATAKDAILVWNTAGLFPARLDVLSGAFVDPHTIVFTPGWRRQAVRDLRSNTAGGGRRTGRRTAEPVGGRRGWSRARRDLGGQAQALVVYPDRKRQIVVDGASAQLIGLVPGTRSSTRSAKGGCLAASARSLRASSSRCKATFNRSRPTDCSATPR